MSELERAREFLLGAHQQEYVSLLDAHIAQDKEREAEAELIIHGHESRIDALQAKLEQREAELRDKDFQLARLMGTAGGSYERLRAALEEIEQRLDNGRASD